MEKCYRELCEGKIFLTDQINIVIYYDITDTTNELERPHNTYTTEKCESLCVSRLIITFSYNS